MNSGYFFGKKIAQKLHCSYAKISLTLALQNEQQKHYFCNLRHDFFFFFFFFQEIDSA